MTRPRKLPTDDVLADLFATSTVSEIAAAYEVTPSTVYYHRTRIRKLGDCWVCGNPAIGHSPSDHHDPDAEIPVVHRCESCGRVA